MTFWEILNNIADICYVSFVLMVLFFFAFIYRVIVKKPLSELMKEVELKDVLESETIKRLDKLQDTLDCLASKHLDAETMRELQGAFEKQRKEYEPPEMVELIEKNEQNYDNT